MKSPYYVLYYVELNLACIIILILIRCQSRRRAEQLSTPGILFNQTIWAAVVLCLSDMASGIFHGVLCPGAHASLEISNMLYYEALVVIGYLWTLYTDCRLNDINEVKRKRYWIYAIPMIVFTFVAVINPFTHFLFKIDENNIYERNVGIYLHWIVTWGYLIYPTVRIFRAVLREKNKLRRQEIQPLLYFIVAPAIASALQMLFYGLSTAQLGITISILLLYIMVQGNQILTDALTGLNNRRGLENYLTDHVQRHVGEELSLLMIDINDFKRINDRYGHMTGDAALKVASNILKQACRGMSNRPFLCRYGGDEFVIAGISGRSECNRLIRRIHDECHRTKTESAQFSIDVSIGAATGMCSCMEDAERLLRIADEAMYDAKKQARVLE